MNITVKSFRALIWWGIALSAASAFGDKLFAAQVPSALSELSDKLVRGATPPLAVLTVYMLAWLGAAIVSLVGLYQFKPWARTLSLYLYPLGVLFGVLAPYPFNYTLTPMFSSCVADIAQAVGGAVLAIAYFAPPISNLFDGHARGG